MDPQQQTQQTEKIIVEMLDFLNSSSEEENDGELSTLEQLPGDVRIIKKDVYNNMLTEKHKIIEKSQNALKNKKKPKTAIAKELKKLNEQFPLWNTNEIANINKNKLLNLHNASEIPYGKTSSSLFNNSNSTEVNADIPAANYNNVDWHNKLETNCRRSSSSAYIQEIHKAIYQDTTGHPTSGSADYYQAAQNYSLYGKDFFDFPENIQAVWNDKYTQNTAAENSNSITNFGNCLYPKPNAASPNAIAPVISTAASAAAYYQLCNSLQAQARPPALPNMPGNSTAYGIFLGNKVTYVATTPTTPSFNFVSNSLANAALATSPTILYTNPMLATTTQQYLNTFFKETQFLSAANSKPTATVASSNANGAGIYERLIYGQLLQQQLYQKQQAAAVAAMFQHQQRAAVAAATIAAAARQSAVGVTNSNRTSPQHLTTVPTTTSSSNGLTLFTCTRQARSSSPSELLQMKQQTFSSISVTGNAESSKSTSE